MPRLLHPLHAVLIAGTVPLFLGVLLSDLAYASTYELQWKNFASWLIVGGLVFAGLGLLWAIAELRRAQWKGARPTLYLLLVLMTWIVGFIDALIHAKDAWGSMPESLVFSAIVAGLAIAATGFRFANPGTEPTK